MKKFNVKKLFVTQTCLHVLHYIYLYMSSLCCSQKRQDHFVWSKVRYSTDQKKPNRERVCEWEWNRYRMGKRTRPEWEWNGYRTDTERKWNGYGTVTNHKNGKSVLQNANYKRPRSSEHMLVVTLSECLPRIWKRCNFKYTFVQFLCSPATLRK